MFADRKAAAADPARTLEILNSLTAFNITAFLFEFYAFQPRKVIPEWILAHLAWRDRETGSSVGAPSPTRAISVAKIIAFKEAPAPCNLRHNWSHGEKKGSVSIRQTVLEMHTTANKFSWHFKSLSGSAGKVLNYG